MKLEGLVILFLIIILPISFVLSEYTKAQVSTLDMQITYDSRLNNATYDAIKAFQLNTYNSDTSTLVNSKIRDIEASANTFYNSIAANFKMEGYNKDVLSEYVPALVYIMYDGYYIYSQYTNTLVEHNVINSEGKTKGLKPYIYYSARFKKEKIDVVITYSLDNYIKVQGINAAGNPINISGYVVDNVDKSGDKIVYRGVEISKEEFLSEYVGEKEYLYIKKNGVKYYKDEDKNEWFSVIKDKKYYTTDITVTKDDSAYNYYNEAIEFKQQLGLNGILNLEIKDMEKEGNLFDGMTGNIFDYGNNIEEPDSNFNAIREMVIRYSIEKNLSIAIANYNTYAGEISTDFRMPELKENEWPILANNVCLVSFMQGLSIGGKIYNGYSIVPNNKTKEVIKEDSICIVKDDNYYKVNDKVLEDIKLQNAYGVSKLSFERKSIITYVKDQYGIERENIFYYYPNKALGSYTSIVTSSNVDLSADNIFKYLDASKNENLKKIYYTALRKRKIW